MGLLGGAEMVVRGGSRLAAALGMSPLIIGLTLVAFGTSAPEIAVSVQATLAGNGDVAVGNVAGSNIFNILVVLGLSATIAPLVVERQLIWMDVPVLIAVSTLPILLGLDGRYTRGEGLFLLALGVVYTGVLGWLAFRDDDPGDPSPGGTAHPAAPTADGGPVPESAPPSSPKKDRVVDLVLLALGFGALVLGAGWFIEGATTVARAMGMSELVIGLTLVAAATSLPELATSAMAAVRGQRDMAVGNAVGSNIFNILIVLGAAAASTDIGIDLPLSALTFDLPIVLMVGLACLPVFFTGHRISRWEGVVLLVYYGIYLTYILLKAGTHDVEDEFVAAIQLFVVPLTLIMVVGGWWWASRTAEAEGS